jgi:hypothetical protein
MSAFKPATRQAVKLKLGLMGPSGSGKTYSADRLAAGLCPGGKIAFLDTENGSASLYADRFAFDVLDMHAPFTVQKFLAAIDDAVKAGYDCLIIDSISAEWQELLAEKELLDARGGNSFTNWGSITKKHEDFKKAFVQAPIHIIACMRSKQEYVLQTNDKGKQAPVKVGMGAVQREGFEYECSVVFDIDMSHHAKASKDRSSLFGDDIFQITEDTGKILRDWLQKGGAPVPEPEPHTTSATAIAPQGSAPPAATVETRATPPRAQSAAQPVAQGAKAPTPSPEPPAEWVSAMTELAAATLGMPEQTRAKLVATWEAEGPEKLKELKAEISTIRQTMEPTTAGAVIAQLPPLPKTPVSEAASNFVDDMDPDTDEPNGGISPEQYGALTQLIGAFGINRDALRSYCFKAGHLLPGANGPTLARMKADYFVQLRDKLCNKKIASGKETWSERTVRIINATPTTTFQPIPAAS